MANSTKPMTLRENIAAMPTREEWLGGQRTKYIQRDEVLAYIDAHLATREVTSEHVSVPRELAEDAEIAFREAGYLGDALQLSNILSRATPSDVRCTTCGGTGDVHRADGEWLGECTACDANKPSAPRVVTEPLSVFSGGMWTWNETGQSFTKAEMDEAAFIVYRDHAESFATYLPAAIPPGFVVVPESATDVMLEALEETMCVTNKGTLLNPCACWDAMLDAAPQAGERG